MALLNNYLVKQAIGLTAGQTLTLEADPGESFLIRDVRVAGNDAEYTDFSIDKTKVGRFRTAKALGSHLCFGFGSAKIPITDYLNASVPKDSILSYLGRLGLFEGYPVATGQKFTVSPNVATAYLGTVEIVYEQYEAGDMTKEMPNGSNPEEYLYVNYADVGSAITTAGDYLLATVNSPAEFPDFPVGKDVPANKEIDILGILASEAYDWDDATHITYTTYLKLMQERHTLFDEDGNGLLFQGSDRGAAAVKTYFGEGYSLLGNLTAEDTKPPLIFPTPLTFKTGEELNAYITAAIVTNAASIAQAGSEVGFIERVRVI